MPLATDTDAKAKQWGPADRSRVHPGYASTLTLWDNGNESRVCRGRKKIYEHLPRAYRANWSETVERQWKRGFDDWGRWSRASIALQILFSLTVIDDALVLKWKELLLYLFLLLDFFRKRSLA